MDNTEARTQYLQVLLCRHLADWLGDIEEEPLRLLLDHLEWVELPGGATLMTQGESGDSMYLIVSGRLRAYIADESGQPQRVREISRGETVGEMSLYTDAPRSATLIAIRDSVLVRLPKHAFRQLLALSGQISIALTRQIIDRLQHDASRSHTDRPVTIALLPISDGVDLADIASQLATALRGIGRAVVVDAAALDAELGDPGITHRPQSDTEANRRVALRLDEIEAANDFVLLVGDTSPTEWTSRCSRHGDELYLFADAAQACQIHPIEQHCLDSHVVRSDASEILVLLHPAGLRSPRHTAQWLARRQVAGHVHLRPALQRDLGRLARLMSRTAVGLVLAGGGARGLAHLGVYRALQQRGIEIDVVGGTSIGSVMATYVDSDQPADSVIDNARRAFSVNPTGDFNLIPLVSLIKGLRLRRTVSQALHELVGADGARIEDLWKSYYCVATNYSKACEQVIQRGPLLEAMLASIAIPGALPPMISDGDLLCDGGTFNNYPVDVMRGMRGVGTVIGVDLVSQKQQRIEHAEVPGSLALLRDRLRPRARRRYRMPSLAVYLMNVMVLYSNSRRSQARAMTDVYMNPPMSRVGMLQWERFDQIVDKGHAHACEVLDSQATQAVLPASHGAWQGVADRPG